eukprot:Plantae.Rhodophyta-Rhodochaete_pulchella.ctg10861.p1 GENE.Plantae.Rhodophyta-Rhodochaete_pulchella.ctg10861~~Plantae.Rhodophyta-Rhodochaete_pulchella.ctg10861.p1  ORF type:complete len:504 (+),score=83.73 Plantae.Rhodophyta-Rhodochaete_pulchella.ctg10861:34-1545(+)
MAAQEEPAKPVVLLPIDIHYRKLLDWLVDRKKVTREWRRAVRDIRLSIERALARFAENPNDKATELLRGRYVDYFTAKDLLELLVNQEPKSAAKDMFGRYTDPDVKAWYDIVRAYEAKHVHLAECAQLRVNNTDTEAAMLKKTVARCKDTIGDLKRKEGETARAAAEARIRFKSACDLFGCEDIEGGPTMEQQLAAFAADRAPAVLEAAVEAAQDEKVTRALDYYEVFLSHATYSSKHRCLTLKEVRKLDKSTAAPRWRAEQEQANEPEEPKVADLDLDLDIDLNAETEAPADIDWGIELGDAPQQVAETPEPAEIKWDVGLDSSATSAEHLEPEGPVQLDEDTVRGAYLDDLFELQTFLEQRQREEKERKATFLVLQAQALPQELMCESEDLQNMTMGVKSAIDALTSTKARRTLSLKTSDRFLVRQARELAMQKFNFRRQENSIEETKERLIQLGNELETAGKRLVAIVEQTLNMKTQVEQAISALYDGRPVHIMGEINTL